MIFFYLLIVGLCLGSFVNALVWRIRQQELKAKSVKRKGNRAVSSSQYSVLHGRSMCPNCKHILSAADLIPVFSWLFLRGKCRYCKKSISAHYPLIELAMAMVFLVSYFFWPVNLSGGQWLLFSSWLVSSVGLMALAIYDLKWMLLPNRILYPTLAVALTGRIGYIAFYSDSMLHDLYSMLLGVAVASGIFWLLFHASKGKWIGYGDVRLGLVTGALLASPDLAFLMIFSASILGTLYSLPLIVAGKQKLAGKIPFGPFLIAGTFIVLLFGQKLLDWYNDTLL